MPKQLPFEPGDYAGVVQLRVARAKRSSRSLLISRRGSTFTTMK